MGAQLAIRREQLESRAEALLEEAHSIIAILDALDGDTDGEDDDDREAEVDCCEAGDDGVFAGSAVGGHNCTADLSKWDDDREEEWRSLPDDVPALPVYSNERGDDGRREYLGHNNLQPSYKGGGRCFAYEGGEVAPA